MFQALKPLLANGKVKIELSVNKDETITVMVSQSGEGPLAIPLSLTATAEELDAQFVTVITDFSRTRKSLEEQLAATTAILEATKAESSAKATKALTKAPKSTLVNKASPSDDLGDDENGDGCGEGDGGSIAMPAMAKPANVSSSNLFDFEPVGA